MAKVYATEAANAIAARGAKVVFADVDTRTLNLDPAAVAEKVTPRTKAILPVHLYGQCCDMDALVARGGEFKNGMYSWVDADGKHRNQDAAEAIYEEKLKDRLEKTNFGDFIAIEPESGDYFLGQSLTEAGEAAEAAYPDRRCFVLRVGYRAAVFIGAMPQ